jgi:hypothetical protein
MPTNKEILEWYGFEFRKIDSDNEGQVYEVLHSYSPSVVAIMKDDILLTPLSGLYFYDGYSIKDNIQNAMIFMSDVQNIIGYEARISFCFVNHGHHRDPGVVVGFPAIGAERTLCTIKGSDIANAMIDVAWEVVKRYNINWEL